MQKKHLFEYAIIRVMPRVEREEFLNVGVILYCRDLNFLQAKFTINRAKLLAFAPQLDMQEVEEHLEAICHICKGDTESGPIGKLTLPERFRWLTAIRSTVVQTSKIHPGFCINADEMLNRLYAEMVL